MKPKRTKQVRGIIIGSLLLVVSPILACLLYVSGALRAFDTLGDTGIGDPQRLNNAMNAVLYACPVGLAGSVIGLLILLISIVCFVRAGRAISASPES